jgi:hypothetical protein
MNMKLLDYIDRELFDVLQDLLNTGEINESTINILKDGYEELKNINLNELSESDTKNLEEKISLTHMVLVKYEEQFDNTTLIKTTNYLTPSQIHYLDRIAEEKRLIGQGKRKKTGSRSAALRLIIDEHRK